MTKVKLIVVAYLILLVAACSRTPPSDAEMEANFRSNEKELNKLVSMLKQDASLFRVDRSGAYLSGGDPDKAARADLDPKRMDEYRQLLTQGKVTDVSRYDAEISIGAWNGWYGIDPSSSQTKGYVYSERPPKNIHNSLDRTDELLIDGSQPEAYKKIAENWYLQYSRVD